MNSIMQKALEWVPFRAEPSARSTPSDAVPAPQEAAPDEPEQLAAPEGQQ
ncbi:hypothetical protein [Nonomuraea dietziae]